MKYKEVFTEFIERLEDRMKKGFEEYGDDSFNRTPAELVQEIEEELLDICGWSVILYSKIRNMK